MSVTVVKIEVIKIEAGFVFLEVEYNSGTMTYPFSLVLAVGDTANIDVEGFVLAKFMEN